MSPGQPNLKASKASSSICPNIVLIETDVTLFNHSDLRAIATRPLFLLILPHTKVGSGRQVHYVLGYTISFT